MLPRPRHQVAGRVEAWLDADAHLHVWEPNRTDDRIDVDLTSFAALLIDLGLGQPRAPEPHWTDTEGTTLLVSFESGAQGRVLVDEQESTADAAVRLAAAGFLRLLRDAVAPVTGAEDRRDDGDRDEGADPADGLDETDDPDDPVTGTPDPP